MNRENKVKGIVIALLVAARVRLSYVLLNKQKKIFDEICALLKYYAASISNSVPTIRDDLLVPSPKAKKSKQIAFLFECSSD